MTSFSEVVYKSIRKVKYITPLGFLCMFPINRIYYINTCKRVFMNGDKDETSISGNN